MATNESQTTQVFEQVLRKHGLIGNKSNSRKRISKNSDGTYSIQVNIWMWLWTSFVMAFILNYVLAPEVQRVFSFGTWWLLFFVNLLGSFIIIRMALWLASIIRLPAIMGVFSLVGFKGWLLVGAILIIGYLANMVYQPNWDLSSYWKAGISWLHDNTILGGMLGALNSDQNRSGGSPVTGSSPGGSDPTSPSGEEGSSTPMSSPTNGNAPLDADVEAAYEAGFNLHSDGSQTAIRSGTKCRQKRAMALCNGFVSKDVFPLHCDPQLSCISGTISGRKQTADCAITSCPVTGSTSESII